MKLFGWRTNLTRTQAKQEVGETCSCDFLQKASVALLIDVGQKKNLKWKPALGAGR